MKRFLIEDVRIGISKGGIACGPASGNVIGEIVLRDDDGKASYHCMVEVSGTLNYYRSDFSIYQGQIDEDFDNIKFVGLMESSFAEGYVSYYDFYREINTIQPLSITARIQKYLAYLVRAGWSETNRLKADAVGKLISDFEIPLCDAEEEYLKDTLNEEEGD